MDPLSVTASIIAVLQLSAKVLVYISDVRDAPKERSHCEAEISNLSALLRDLRDHVQTGDLSQPWYTAVAELAAPKGQLDQFKQALEALQNKIADGGRLRRVGEALVWKFKKEEIVSILDRIERLKTLVEVALQMDHFKLSQAIKDDTTFVRTHVPAIQSRVDEIQQDQADAKHNKMVGWISPTNYPAQQSDIISRRQKGTGQWFLDAPEIARWLGEPKSTLFCPGIPGAGKTMAAAIAIDHLLKSAQSSLVGVAYVYCNYKAQEEQDAYSMLAAIIKQLVQGRPSMAEPVERLHKQHVDRGTKPSVEEIFGALREVVAKYSTVYVVVDALDECRDSDGTRSQLLARLRDLQVGEDVRIMATSRFIPEIEVEFQIATKLEIQASDEDVRRYIAGQTHRLPRCIQRDPALQATMQDKLVEAVDGMFLLARLHTDSLLDKRTVKEVKSTLARLSTGSAALINAYNEAIQRVEGQLSGDCERAKKVLSWITHARRPLTTAELCCALAVEPDEAELDPENIPDIEDLISVCAGLVVVDRESAVIRLVHYTTQEYFERIRDTWIPGAPLQLATTCLTYLSFSAFQGGICSTRRKFKKRLRQNQFLNYAAKHWGDHAISVEGEVAGLACSFLLRSGLLMCATQVLFVSDQKYYKDYPIITALHCTARFGLATLTEVLLLIMKEEATDAVNATDSWGQAPLLYAAKHGHVETTKLLLENNASVNVWCRRYGNALHAASKRGHAQVVKLLLENNADVEAQNKDGENALHAASYRGHVQVVKLLLENNADVNAQDVYLTTALRLASLEGHVQVVKLLLEKNADVNAQDEGGDNALNAAAYGGHTQVVKLLLEKNADVNTPLDDYYGCTLQMASYAGYEEIVKLLLEKNADVHAQDLFWGNALQAASKGGHTQVVKLLLGKNADVNAQNKSGENALYAASYEGYEQVAKLLLKKNANVNALGGHYGNALQAASFRGHEAIVKLLLEKSVEVNAQGGESDHRTPLELRLTKPE